MSNESDDHLARLSALWLGYAKKVYGDYSPVNATLAQAVGEDGDILRLVQASPPHVHDPNMLLATIQYMVLSGLDTSISAIYDGTAAGASVAPIVHDFCVGNWLVLSELMAGRYIQTNEVGRASILALGIACAAGAIGEPIALIDAGASAGLNLWLDDYLLTYGGAHPIGPPDSPVRVDTTVRTPPPAWPTRLPAIERRLGLDRAPVDLTVPDNVRWLLACIWPGTGRQARAAAAMELAAARPSLVRHADMVDDLPAALGEMSPLPTVVVTSWSYSYLPMEVRVPFVQAMVQAGRDRPVAWVCADGVWVADIFKPPTEPAGDDLAPSLLGLAIFDGRDRRETAVAYIQPHGAWIDWLDDQVVPSRAAG